MREKVGVSRKPHIAATSAIAMPTPPADVSRPRARSSRAVQITADTLWPWRANTRESEARKQPSAAA